MKHFTPTHVIVFKDGSHKYVSRDQYELIISPRAAKAGKVNIDNEIIDLNVVGRVMELGKFYDSYPKHRPAVNQTEEYTQLPEPKNRFTHEQNVSRMRQAALKAQRSERLKYGTKGWSREMEELLPSSLKK